jgi:peptide/nickel transport system ATP-binding protein
VNALPTTAPAVMLEMQGLVVERPSSDGALRLINGVSLTLRAARILGVVGESGAGKSLTGTALMGLLEPPLRQSAGTLRFRGNIVDAAAPLRRGRDIGMIFQDPLTALNPLFTVGHQLIETIRIHHRVGLAAAQERSVSLLTEVGISAPRARLKQYPHELSGGMRQRVVIALALAPDPAVLVADEPTTALDVSIQAQIVALIRRICDERGMAVLLVTHDMGVIAEAADEVAVMYAGRVVESGSVVQILRNPIHPYTRGLLASTLEIGARHAVLRQIAGNAPGPDALPSGCAFHPRCPDRTAQCIAAAPSLRAVGRREVACWNHPHG